MPFAWSQSDRFPWRKLQGSEVTKLLMNNVTWFVTSRAHAPLHELVHEGCPEDHGHFTNKFQDLVDLVNCSWSFFLYPCWINTLPQSDVMDPPIFHHSFLFIDTLCDFKVFPRSVRNSPNTIENRNPKRSRFPPSDVFNKLYTTNLEVTRRKNKSRKWKWITIYHIR